MGFRMGLDIDSGIAHLGEVFPCHRFPAGETARRPDAFRVNEQRQRITVFLQDGPGDFVLRLPAIIEGQNSRA